VYNGTELCQGGSLIEYNWAMGSFLHMTMNSMDFIAFGYILNSYCFAHSQPPPSCNFLPPAFNETIYLNEGQGFFMSQFVTFQAV